MSFIEQYLLQLNTEKQRWRRAVVILTALSLVVALVTVWNLRMTGVTIANSASCGYEEHQHTEECIATTTLICGYDSTKAPTDEIGLDTVEATTAETEETTVATDATAPESIHTHTDECYTTVYSCGLEEHIHSLSCYSDPSADVETAEIWEASLPDDLGKYWSENLARIAISQIGITESEKIILLLMTAKPSKELPDTVNGTEIPTGIGQRCLQPSVCIMPTYRRMRFLGVRASII